MWSPLPMSQLMFWGLLPLPPLLSQRQPIVHAIYHCGYYRREDVLTRSPAFSVPDFHYCYDANGSFVFLYVINICESASRRPFSCHCSDDTRTCLRGQWLFVCQALLGVRASGRLEPFGSRPSDEVLSWPMRLYILRILPSDPKAPSWA